MDVNDPTDALLTGLINAERVIDKAVKDFYNKNARVNSAIIAVLNDNFDDPSFEHDAPSAPRCLGNKRSFSLCWTEEQTIVVSMLYSRKSLHSLLLFARWRRKVGSRLRHMMTSGLEK